MTKQIKVTDRRMFTPDGRLREEYQGIEAAPASAAQPMAAAPIANPAPAEEVATSPTMTLGEDIPGTETDADAEPQAGFMDLLGLLAEHASVYLRQGSSGAGMEAGQSLEMAKLHIDLLAVVKEKTAGNLSPQETAALDEVLYQLKMGFMQVGG